MKTIYFTIIASLLLFCTALFPNQANAVVCQNKTTIVYSNGMFRDREEARSALVDELKERLEQKSVIFSDTTKYEYKLAFANGQGGPVGTTGLDQLLEVARQALGDKSMDLFWKIMGGVATDPVIKQAVQDIASQFTQAVYVNDPDAIAMTGEYRTLLNQGKRILIVAHSQGNFYTNVAYNKLTTENPSWASSIGVVAVATPANSSPGGKLGVNEPNITVPEDFVIGTVRNSFGSLAEKSDKTATALNPWGWSSNVTSLSSALSLFSFEQTTLGHGFVNWYLAGTYTRDFIMKGIVDTINAVGAYAGLQYPTRPSRVFLDGVLPNPRVSALLQNTKVVTTGQPISTPFATWYDYRRTGTFDRWLTVHTATQCGASTSFMISKNYVTTPAPEFKIFLTSLGYGESWMLNATWVFWPTGVPYPSIFPSLGSLQAYADPLLLGLGKSLWYCRSPTESRFH